MFSRFRVAAVIFCLAAMPVFAACNGDIGPTGPPGPDGPPGADGLDGLDAHPSVLGFASLNAGDGPTGACIWLPAGAFLPCLYHFGGVHTDSVTVTQNAVGDYAVRFYGSYEPFEAGGAAMHDFTILATVNQGDGTYVAAASNSSDGGAFADGTEVFTRVQIWKTDDLTPADKDFSVLIVR